MGLSRTRRLAMSALPVALLLGLGCGGAERRPGSGRPGGSSGGESSATRQSRDAARKRELLALFDREAEPKGPRTVAVEGQFRGTIHSQSKPVVKRLQGVYQVDVQAGAIGPVQCFVYDDLLDPANAMAVILREAGATVTFTQGQLVEFSHAGMVPTVGVRMLYQATTDAGVAAGDLKLVYIGTAPRPVICVHDQPGYVRSFLRLASDFAQSLQATPVEQRAEPLREELWMTRIDGQPAGYNYDRRFEREGGGDVHWSIRAAFIQVSETEFMSRDGSTVVETNPRGEVVEASYITVEAGERVLELELKRSGRTAYRYRGTIQGKPVEGSLRTPKPLREGFDLEARLSEVKRRPTGKTYRIWEYSPSIDPTTAVLNRYRVKPDGTGFATEFEQAGTTAHGRANAQGVMEVIRVSLGNRLLESQLVARRTMTP